MFFSTHTHTETWTEELWSLIENYGYCLAVRSLQKIVKPSGNIERYFFGNMWLPPEEKYGYLSKEEKNNLKKQNILRQQINAIPARIYFNTDGHETYRKYRTNYRNLLIQETKKNSDMMDLLVQEKVDALLLANEFEGELLAENAEYFEWQPRKQKRLNFIFNVAPTVVDELEKLLIQAKKCELDNVALTFHALNRNSIGDKLPILKSDHHYAVMPLKRLEIQQNIMTRQMSRFNKKFPNRLQFSDLRDIL